MTIISCNFCYSQQLDKDIEAVKKEIVGTWRPSDTSVKEKYSYHFTPKKYTFTIYCENNTVLKKTMRYYVKKEHNAELNRDIIILVLLGNRKLTHDCNYCIEKTLDHLTVSDWMDVVIKNDSLTFYKYFDNPKDYTQTLIKETKTNR